MAKKLTTEEFIERARAVHGDRYDYSLVEYKGCNEKIKIICREHGEFNQSANKHINAKQGCSKCSGNNKLDFKIINERLNNMHHSFRFYENQTYKKNNIAYKGWCANCGESHARWANLQQGAKAGCCVNAIVTNKNRVWKTHRHLTKYFKIPEESKTIVYGSDNKVNLICPDCGTEKTMRMATLSKNGFSCAVCSDGISIPEKFVMFLLKLKYIDFITQHKINDKKYDFYIPSLNMIIETHGGQHYKQSNRGRSLEEEQENDRLKEKLARENGIEHYIIIDCRSSEFEWLKQNINSTFQKYFKLNDIDFKMAWSKCQNSLCVETWRLWKNKNNEQNTKDIANAIGLHRGTIIRYLKIGVECGKCDYDPKYEQSLNARKTFSTNGIRKINQYTLNKTFVKNFESAMDIQRQLLINHSSISSCCKGRYKTAGGFIWRYADDLEGIAELEKLRLENEKKLLTSEIKDDIM